MSIGADLPSNRCRLQCIVFPGEVSQTPLETKRRERPTIRTTGHDFLHSWRHLGTAVCQDFAASSEKVSPACSDQVSQARSEQAHFFGLQRSLSTIAILVSLSVIAERGPRGRGRAEPGQVKQGSIDVKRVSIRTSSLRSTFPNAFPQHISPLSSGLYHSKYARERTTGVKRE